MKRAPIALAAALTVTLAAGSALARSSILGDFNAEYGTARTRLDDCVLCHGSNYSFNPYGSAVRANANLGYPGAFRAVEGDDSDRDGFTNAEEIAALSFPGDGSDVPAPAPGPVCTDADRDGYALEGGTCGPVDCNDRDATVNPGATEVCNDAKDNDCNGAVDNQDSVCAVPLPCTDDDGDGWCVEDGDCNDANASIYPGAFDVCLDGIDQDCSGRDRTKGKGCSTTKSVRVGTEGKGKTCSDGLDNDLDGAVDCADPDCAGSRSCP